MVFLLLCFGIAVPIFNCILVATNRLAAVTLGKQYKTVFSAKNTVIIVCLTWILSFLMVLPLFFDACAMIFSYDYYALVYYVNGTCSAVMGFIGFFF